MELRAFIDFMRKRSQSGGPKTFSLDGKFYASFPSINQISGGLFQSLVHSSTISQQIKSASEQVRAFWAREANQLVVWSQMIFYHKKHQIHGEQRYLHRAMQAGSHLLNCSSTLLESLLAINTSQEPGRYHAYLSKIPSQCTAQADTCKKSF